MWAARRQTPFGISNTVRNTSQIYVLSSVEIRQLIHKEKLLQTGGWNFSDVVLMVNN